MVSAIFLALYLEHEGGAPDTFSNLQFVFGKQFYTPVEPEFTFTGTAALFDDETAKFIQTNGSNQSTVKRTGGSFVH